MSRLRALAAFVIAIFVVACSDDSPTSPPDVPGPNAAILDAINGAGGNPYVFLKPPVVPDPPTEVFGVFNSALAPFVDVCRLDYPSAGDCELLQTNDGTNSEARYSLDGGPGGESITVDLTAEEYQLEIHFRLFDLMEDETYRVVTRLGEKELAYADLLVTSPQEMRNVDGGSSIVFTNDNKTLPWRFRIDQGALCWEPGETVTACTSATVEEGNETTVSLTSSDGEEVDLHLPSGWTASVDGQSVGDLTLSIEEAPGDDLSCFENIQFGDPAPGEPTNCYEVRADTESETDVEVQFGGTLPIMSFCPSQEVLQAMANGLDGWVIASAEEDAGSTTFQTYQQVQAPPDFGGCTLPPPDEVDALFGDGLLGRFASSVWRRVRPVVAPILPRPLYAFDIGFGAKLPALTIFYWSRTPVGLAVSPAAPSLGVGETVQLSPDPEFHEGALVSSSLSSIYDVAWDSDTPSAATVDSDGLVTGVAAGTATITATATNLLDETSAPLAGSVEVTVTAPPDLVVQTLTHSPSDPNELDLIEFTAVVANVGLGPSGPSTLMFKIGGETPGAPATLFSVPVLNPGDTYQVQRQATLISQGYINTAVADYSQAVVESDETNNTTQDFYSVTAAPDLIVSSMTHTPEFPQPGQLITFTATVQNLGPGPSRPTTLMFQVGGETVPASFSVPALSPGDSYTATREESLSVAQNYLNTATADVHDEVPETDETNNTGTDAYLVEPDV